MEGADALGLLAEIGIAIAGFAGVIATLRAPGGKMGSYEALRIGVLLGQSANVVLLALLPFALHFAGLSVRAIWFVSSSAMAVLVMMAFLLMLRVAKAVVPVREEDRTSGSKFVFVSTIAVTTGIVALQLGNLTFLRQLWPFYVGLLTLITQSLFAFAYILFAPSRGEVQA
jgi:hypothetical protein